MFCCTGLTELVSFVYRYHVLGWGGGMGGLKFGSLYDQNMQINFRGLGIFLAINIVHIYLVIKSLEVGI